MAERDYQLHGMANKTDEFSSSAARFSKGAMHLRRQQEWQRRKMCIMAICVAAALAWLFWAHRIRKTPQFHSFVQISAVTGTLLLAVGLLVRRCCWPGDDDAMDHSYSGPVE
mmetsp:Transcript_101177/g.198556  ORF Transcript_101177/g.198556 Transcript_101177/m.198556 type:complete len:112 (+) Transcript_101177:2-337(+)